MLILFLKNLFLNIVTIFIDNLSFDGRIRAYLYSKCLPNIIIGNRCSIRNKVRFYQGKNLSGNLRIGNSVFVNEEVFIDLSSQVIVGNNVSLGMRVMILSSTHSIGNPVRCGSTKRKVTVIGNGCWIGAGAIIYPGVRISDGVVISAGEVVSFDIPENMILKKGLLIPIKS
ncbi:acyltransferase [Citrobacter freundii]|nr:acyltransferase [Citrobacter freundii]MBJ7588467.1 acyltransferase [Citrobacter freundii]